MTGLKIRRKQKTLFQNIKMDDKLQKLTKKFNNAGRKIAAEDILEVVVDMKRTVNVLEDIAKQLVKLVNDTNDTKRLEEGLYEKDFNPKKCNLCGDTFKNISELEKHIKEKHDEYDTFECETCGKKFVTNFRLEKHVKMHLNVAIKTCHYFRRRKPCPYENLGCKFRHELENKENIKNINGHHVEHVINSIDETDRNDTEEDTVDHTIGHIDDKVSKLDEFYISLEKTSRQNVGSFHASTPKKTYPCEECEIGSECVDCFVVHMLGRHTIARLAFA